MVFSEAWAVCSGAFSPAACCGSRSLRRLQWRRLPRHHPYRRSPFPRVQVLQQTPRRNTGRRTANAGGFDSLLQHARLRFDASAYGGSQSGKGGFDWDALTTPSSGQQPLYQDEPKKPAGFDEEEFLRGAKAAYTRLNNAWDKRDLSDIAQFSTPAFQKEIQQQAAEDKTPGNTEIMLVNASLLSVDTVGDEQIAQVYFNVLLREDPSQEAPIDVREIWHFVRPASGDGTWKLDGIQQVENV